MPQEKPQLTQDTTVNGRPATLQRFAPTDSTPPSPPTWRLRWQPVDGLWARIDARDFTEHTFRAVAQTLRLDRAQRCVQPLQATAVPPGARWTESHVGISARLDGGGGYPGLGVWWYSGFTLAKADGTTLSASLEPVFPHDPASTKDEFRPDTTVSGRPAQWTPPYRRAQGQLRITPFYQRFNLYVLGDSKAEVLALAAGLRVVGDLTRPATWPQRAVL